MFENLNVASKVICFLIALFGVIGLLTCIGLLIENIKARKARIKNNQNVKKFEPSIIVPSTIVGVSTLAIVLSIVVPFSVDRSIGLKKKAYANPFVSKQVITMENLFDGFDSSLISEAKKSEHVSVRNFEVSFTWDVEKETYYISEEKNDNSLILLNNEGLNYFYTCDIKKDNLNFYEISKRKNSFPVEIKYEYSEKEPGIEDFNKVLKGFDKSLFFNNFVNPTNPNQKKKYIVLSAKLLYGFKGFTGYLVDKANNINKYYERGESLPGYKDKYGLEIKLVTNHEDTLKTIPERTYTYIF